jgi:16S rRNA (guanine966-N2)-methyltransferase
MRIISGLAGGIPLKVPDAVTRPTTDKVRQALFSSLGELVAGARVLDLFAGSGALGLEALSRGAASALFVEQHRGAVGVIRANLAKSRLQGGVIRSGDVMRVVGELAELNSEPYDLIFADPPYAHHARDKNWAIELLQSAALKRVLAPHGSFILECRVTTAELSPSWGWSVVRDREYGSTRLLWLKQNTDGIANP